MKKNLTNLDESGSDGAFVTGLGGFLHDVGLPSGVTFSSDESCDGYRGSIFP